MIDYKVEITIHSKTGRWLDGVSSHPHESEVLFSPNAKFVVKKVKQVEDRVSIIIEELD